MSQTVATSSNDVSHFRESAVAVKDAVADLAGEAGRLARHRLSETKDSAAAMMGSVKSKAATYNDAFVGTVRRNPYKSLAIATGIGLVLGFLFRRR